MSRIVLTIGLVICLSGCGRGPSVAPGTLIYGRGTDADTLDPIHTSIGESAKVIVNLYDTLVTYDETTTDLVPALAESWEVSDAGRRWKFAIRPGVTFHDGTPLDAEAVVTNFRRTLEDDHPLRLGGTPPYFPYFAAIETVAATGPLEVTFQLAEPNAVFLKNLAMFSASIVSPTALEKQGEKFRDHPVGTGPFQFKSWRHGQEIVLEAFDDHWRGRPQVDRVIFLATEESSIRGEQLKRGEIHIADNMQPSDLDALAEHPDIELQQQSGMNVGYLCFQTEKPPLDNPKVRQAIAMAIDKRRLIDVAYAGHARPAVNPLPPTVWAYHEEIDDRPYDRSAAKELLAKASRESGFGLPLELTLFQMTGPRPYMQQPRQTATFIKDALAEIGIRVTIETADVRQYFGRLSKGEHELALAGWSSDKVDPDDFLFTFFHSRNINDDGGNNMSRYRNPEVDRLLDQAQQELDESRRKALYEQVQEIVFADAPVVPLIHSQVRIAQRKELHGYVLHPSSMVRLRRAYFEDPQR